MNMAPSQIVDALLILRILLGLQLLRVQSVPSPLAANELAGKLRLQSSPPFLLRKMKWASVGAANTFFPFHLTKINKSKQSNIQTKNSKRIKNRSKSNPFLFE